MNDRTLGHEFVTLSNKPVFALCMDFVEKICMFSFSLNTLEKAENKQTVPTAYMRKIFLFIIMISHITTF